jgi:hypothetical protein
MKQIKNKKTKSKAPYSPELRKFAVTLHFYSRKAYEYVRKKFGDCLPCNSTISRWYQNVDGDPGFQQQAFDFLHEKNKNRGRNIFFFI